jgi:hypothetical protein
VNNRKGLMDLQKISHRKTLNLLPARSGGRTQVPPLIPDDKSVVDEQR